MRLVSIGTKIRQLDGLTDTKDLKDNENEFVKDMVERTREGLVTSLLSERQVDYIESLWARHFA